MRSSSYFIFSICRIGVGGKHLSYDPILCMISYFTPIGNLFGPMQDKKEITRRQDLRLCVWKSPRDVMRSGACPMLNFHVTTLNATGNEPKNVLLRMYINNPASYHKTRTRFLHSKLINVDILMTIILFSSSILKYKM